MTMEVIESTPPIRSLSFSTEIWTASLANLKGRRLLTPIPSFCTTNNRTTVGRSDGNNSAHRQARTRLASRNNATASRRASTEAPPNCAFRVDHSVCLSASQPNVRLEARPNMTGTALVAFRRNVGHRLGGSETCTTNAVPADRTQLRLLTFSVLSDG